MRRRVLMFLTWLAVTVLAVTVASAAVNNVRSAVTDTPAPLGLPAVRNAPAISLGPATPTTDPALMDPSVADPPIAATTVGTTDTPSRETPDGPVLAETSTTTTGAASPPTTTTIATTTSTSASPLSGEVRTYTTEGGWVTIRITSDGVYFEGAGPNQGWHVETEGLGPGEVSVEFDRAEEEVHFRASFENGEVIIDIED